MFDLHEDGTITVDEMGSNIRRMMWADWDGFFKAFGEIAEGETKREVISSELLDFWKRVKDVTGKVPFLYRDID